MANKFVRRLSTALAARDTLIIVQTVEERRAEGLIMEAAALHNRDVVFWDCASGVTDAAWSPKGPGPQAADPNQALAWIRDIRQRSVVVMRDIHKWMDPVILRAVRNLARRLQSAPASESRSMVMLLPPGAEVPPEWVGHATVILWDLPDREDIGRILDDVLSAIPAERRPNAIVTDGRDACVDAAVGLTAEEAGSCYAASLVECKRIDAKLVRSEKKRVIARDKLLTWYDPDARGLESVGGYALLKRWLTQHRSALSQDARAFGLPAPKGILLLGPPGTGKSATAKAVASAWGLPLLRLDLGALRSKYVGESEGNIRRALATAEAVAPCVLWVDEIEKALAGSTGPQGDGGVAADALGSLLSWMQEHTAPVFVVATANDVRALPPELLRKGRFDEMFFIDLPTTAERAEIVSASLRQYERDPASIDCAELARRTPGFTGAELSAVVPDALFAAYSDGKRDLSTADLLSALEGVVPLSKTAAEKIQGLRDWSVGRCRMASEPETTAIANGRVLDM